MNNFLRLGSTKNPLIKMWMKFCRVSSFSKITRERKTLMREKYVVGILVENE